MRENRGVTTVEQAPTAWACDSLSGTAQELHEADMSTTRRLLRLNSVTRPAIVLGSAQRAVRAVEDAVELFGVDLARRRSGGGAVWLAPGEQCWIDLWLPANDPLWVSDVEQSSWWLGECWAQALTLLSAQTPLSAATRTSLHAAVPQVHRGPLLDRELSQIACFAGLGPGEITVDGRKVVGISQRRSRLGAKFQCVVYTQWDPEPLLAVLQAAEPTASQRNSDTGLSELGSVLRTRVQAAEIAAVAEQVPLERQIFDALLRSLPR